MKKIDLLFKTQKYGTIFNGFVSLTVAQSEYSLFFRGRENDVIPVCEALGIGFVK